MCIWFANRWQFSPNWFCLANLKKKKKKKSDMRWLKLILTTSSWYNFSVCCVEMQRDSSALNLILTLFLNINQLFQYQLFLKLIYSTSIISTIIIVKSKSNIPMYNRWNTLLCDVIFHQLLLCRIKMWMRSCYPLSVVSGQIHVARKSSHAWLLSSESGRNLNELLLIRKKVQFKVPNLIYLCYLENQINTITWN